jgi:hypothetical protein
MCVHVHFCFVLVYVVLGFRSRAGQNRIYTPYMTVYLVISLPKLLYTHHLYMVLANPVKELTSMRHASGLKRIGSEQLIPTSFFLLPPAE